VQKKIIFLLLLMMVSLTRNIVAQDTVKYSGKSRKEFKADPQRATLLAVTFPGFGQIYNRKYWKIPLVYAGFGGIIYAVGYNSSLYNKYMKGYQDFTDKIPETDSYLQIIKNADPSTYDPVLFPESYRPSDAEWYIEGMLKRIDFHRKYRDLSYIGIAAWYLFSILDANVDASLFNYDVIDNLEITVAPMQAISLAQPALGVSVNMRVTF
jgi:hypothetical protein